MIEKSVPIRDRVWSREHRGYLVIACEGDFDVLGSNEQNYYIGQIRKKSEERPELPIAIDVTNYKFHGSDSLRVLFEALNVNHKETLPVISDNNAKLIQYLRFSQLDRLIKFYHSQDELPDLTSSR